MESAEDVWWGDLLIHVLGIFWQAEKWMHGEKREYLNKYYYRHTAKCTLKRHRGSAPETNIKSSSRPRSEDNENLFTKKMHIYTQH